MYQLFLLAESHLPELPAMFNQIRLTSDCPTLANDDVSSPVFVPSGLKVVSSPF
jgi:hypothetical protein